MDENGDGDLYQDSYQLSDRDEYQYGHKDHDTDHYLDENGDADLHQDSYHHSNRDEYQYGHEYHDANNDLDQISNGHLYQDHVEHTYEYAYTHRKYHKELYPNRNAYAHLYIQLNDVGDEYFHVFANDIPHQ